MVLRAACPVSSMCLNNLFWIERFPTNWSISECFDYCWVSFFLDLADVDVLLLAAAVRRLFTLTILLLGGFVYWFRYQNRFVSRNSNIDSAVSVSLSELESTDTLQSLLLLTQKALKFSFTILTNTHDQIHVQYQYFSSSFWTRQTVKFRLRFRLESSFEHVSFVLFALLMILPLFVILKTFLQTTQ